VAIAVATVAAIALLAWLLLRPQPMPIDIGTLPNVIDPDIPTPTPAPEERIVVLFAGSDGLLHPELRSVPLPGELDRRVRAIVEQVLSGPEGRLTPIVPYASEVHHVFLDHEGTAWIDLTAPPSPLAGSSTELMLVYGVVNSVLLNCPELTSVQLLFGGTEVETLTGHLDLSRPLVLNKRFIAS
jgi:germination protein M